MQSDLFDSLLEDAIDDLKIHFSKNEWNRIKDRLEIVLRDRSIKRLFRHYCQDGLTYDKAITVLAERFHLSESQISHIVYPRKRTQTNE